MSSTNSTQPQQITLDMYQNGVEYRLPFKPSKNFAIITDLNKCFGCAGCQMSCKEWNTSGMFGPLPDLNPYGDLDVMFWLRVLNVEVGNWPQTKVYNIPINCFHCMNAPCVPVCPVGATFKRVEDGIVLVDYNKCIGCKYCIYGCPYGNRFFDPVQGVVKKCTHCFDRLYDTTIPPEERIPACIHGCMVQARIWANILDPTDPGTILFVDKGGFVMGPETGANPASGYLPWRSDYAGNEDVELLSQEEYFNVWTATGVVQLGSQGTNSTTTQSNNSSS
ncbi:4Fe-4S dicluster domain-containing protein [Sulfolobus acidocaldarius]|uniref:Conserved 4Fe-4S binding domain protein n=4 Tax=Sulfolobus acidocaldarius TaxID=2285 RepID=Q4J738_SULAC|nr:4Fe-4S dicluster domain-containing protein [Sulfolobus acidocaldarius]AAY81395.1 conserved 4Fe-4S binding domain protein [Sulfolobus acidocaldarius DSM 639]AGE71994.1 4Fe-4S binding domain-containing protein [Sulfolobus acidocaldarius N8]AGE74310.1 4Fe-4S binding domain-containing protein [Sulfolobus acidocaldarius Ron12/I]ALU29811.1 4Fe-4S ferredoxin [Sulfolobus acidocaldarius]ALU32550.1 4Fe-4S ferredoxin [Sulfolobus acidocaldarius]